MAKPQPTVALDGIHRWNMKKLFALLRSVVPSLAFAALLVFALLHQAPKRQTQPTEFVPISYHPYVTHAVGDDKRRHAS
jgi:hypothetical protein